MSKHRLGISALLLCIVCLIAGATGCGYGSPSAHFTANTTAGVAPMSVWFTDMSTGEIESWEWDFDNDGVTDSTYQHVAHLYEYPGDYSVKLIVKGKGGSDSEVKSSFIIVSAPDCEADFVADRTQIHGVTIVHFTDLSTGGVTGWAWDLNGDGIIDSYSQAPSYEYYIDGIYSVTLTITTLDGCTDTITKQGYISVSGCST